MRLYFAMFVMMIMLFGCIDGPTDTNNTTSNISTYTPPVIDVVNNTSIPVDNQSTALPPGYSVNLGDHVSVNYTLWVDGEVYDTNNETLAKEVGLYNPRRIYQPLSFEALFNEGMINGFVFGVIGMEINETLVFTVEPDKGYGVYDPSRVVVIPRYYNMSLYEDVPRPYLDTRGINISNGSAFQTSIGTVFIHDFNDENVTLFYVLSPGHTFTTNGLPQEVIHMAGNLTANIEFKLQENESYSLPHPVTGALTSFKVTNKTDTNITLDSNHPLANKTLLFEVTLLDAKPYTG